MRFPIYRNRLDYETNFPSVSPFLLFAQKYEFLPGLTTRDRRCYGNALLLIAAGEGRLFLEDREIPLQPGMLLYISAGRVHRWEAGLNPPVKYTAYFDWNFVQRQGFRSQIDFMHNLDAPHPFQEQLTAPLPGYPLPEVSRIGNLAQWTGYYHSFMAYPELLDEHHLEDSLRIRGAFQIFLHHFLHHVRQSGHPADPRIQKLLARVESEPLAVVEQDLFRWAEEAGMKRSRFHALFRGATGYSPKQYVQRLKLRQIMDQLSGTPSSMTAIASKFGFASVHYFSRYFHKQTGMTPTQYRKQYR